MILTKKYITISISRRLYWGYTDNIWKIATGQGDDYTTGCLLDYNYFKKHYKLMAIDLSKQQALDADTKAIQKINFSGNLDQGDGATCFS